MIVHLHHPPGQLRRIARTLKRAFDDLQETDSGWYYIQFDHPAWGRDPADAIDARIPGNVIITSDEPGADADVLVIPVGYIDSFTGEAHLGNGAVLPTIPPEEPDTDEERAGEEPNRRLPAVALFLDGNVAALIGSLHETREARFEMLSFGDAATTAITEWLTGI